jgi:hypothetical protein
VRAILQEDIGERARVFVLPSLRQLDSGSDSSRTSFPSTMRLVNAEFHFGKCLNSLFLGMYGLGRVDADESNSFTGRTIGVQER